MKYLGGSFGLGKISFLEAICDGGSDGTEASYEPPVEGDKSMETLDFLKILGSGHSRMALTFSGSMETPLEETT